MPELWTSLGIIVFADLIGVGLIIYRKRTRPKSSAKMQIVTGIQILRLGRPNIAEPRASSSTGNESEHWESAASAPKPSSNDATRSYASAG